MINFKKFFFSGLVFIVLETQQSEGGFCGRKIISGNIKKFLHERSLLLEQVTFR
jgi:hypothetical protein